jgi:type II secretory pathway pseudopilin PulG
MATVHNLVAGVFALLLDPLASLSPLVALVIVSAVAGLLVLGGMRFSSNPRAIRAAKQKVQAQLLATRLYRHELITVWRSLGALLVALAAYVGHMLRPFVVLLIPFALLFAHLDARYGSRPLHPGERTIVKAVAASGTPDQWRLEVPAGVALDSVAVRLPSRHEIDWRVRAETPGSYSMTLVAGDKRVQKSLRVGGSVGASPRRSQATLTALFEAPIEAPIDGGSAVETIEVDYPAQRFTVLGWSLHWVVIFLVVSAVVALLFHRRAGVEF